MSKQNLGFDTLAVHAGAEPDPATGARQVPIYRSTSYVFCDADHAARLFVCSRLTNPTVAALAARVAALEGAAGGIACSSGRAAQIMVLFPLMEPGCNVVSSSRLYGGTVTQFSHTIRRFGWSAKFVDTDDLDAVEAAIDEKTRSLFCETIANPGGYVTDFGQWRPSRSGRASRSSSTTPPRRRGSAARSNMAARWSCIRRPST